MTSFNSLNERDRIIFMLLDLFQRLCEECCCNMSGKGYIRLVGQTIDAKDMKYEDPNFLVKIRDMRSFVKDLTGHRYQISVLCDIERLIMKGLGRWRL